MQNLKIMEEQHQQIKDSNPKNSNLWLYIVLAVLALGIIGLSIWLISIKGEMKDMQAEKEVEKWRLERELDSIVIEHVKIKDAYGEVSDSLAGMDSIFLSQADEIKTLLNYKWDYYKVRKKLTRLQEVAQGYVIKMDSIVVVNQVLTEENLVMKEEIKIGKRIVRDLEREKGDLEVIVDGASVLQLYNLRAVTAHVKGSGKETPSDKIKRVKRVNTCFTVSENSIIEPGKRTIYLRIAQPDKEILIKGRGEKYTFEHNGEALQYSASKEINYQNEAFDLCLQYNMAA